MTLAKSPSSHPSSAVLTTKTQTLLAQRASQSKVSAAPLAALPSTAAWECCRQAVVLCSQQRPGAWTCSAHGTPLQLLSALPSLSFYPQCLS